MAKKQKCSPMSERRKMPIKKPQLRPEIGLWRDLRAYAAMTTNQRRNVTKPKVECPVCYREFDVAKFGGGEPLTECEGFQELVYPRCGHLLCRDCWKGIIAVNSQEPGTPVKCPICRTLLAHEDCGHLCKYVRVDATLERGLVCWGADLPPFSTSWDGASADTLAEFPVAAPEVKQGKPNEGCEHCQNKGKPVSWSWHKTLAQLCDKLWALEDKTTDLKTRWCEAKKYQQAIMHINSIWRQRWPELMFEDDYVYQARLSNDRRHNYFDKKETFDRRCARISILDQELDNLDEQWRQALREQEVAAQNVQHHELARWQPKDCRIDILADNIS